MKDRYTGQPRGFGFITYADPQVVDRVIEDTHVINGKQVNKKFTVIFLGIFLVNCSHLKLSSLFLVW